MRVLTWNLWWRFADWSDRRKAIREVLAETGPDLCGLQEVWSDREENLAGWLVGGDLTEPVVPGQVLLNAWQFAGPGDPGYTWDRRNPHVAEGPEPSGRIDHIWVGLRYTSRGPGHVRSVRLAGDAPIEGIWP